MRDAIDRTVGQANANASSAVSVNPGRGVPRRAFLPHRARIKHSTRDFHGTRLCKDMDAPVRSPGWMFPDRSGNQWVVVAGNHIDRAVKLYQDISHFLYKHTVHTVVLEGVSSHKHEFSTSTL